MQTIENGSQKAWDVVDERFAWQNTLPDEEVRFREIVACFLRLSFPPPDGYVVDVLEAVYGESRFPILAVGWNHDEDSHGRELRTAYCDSLVVPAVRFVAAVNWNHVAQIVNPSRVGFVRCKLARQ